MLWGIDEKLPDDAELAERPGHIDFRISDHLAQCVKPVNSIENKLFVEIRQETDRVPETLYMKG